MSGQSIWAIDGHDAVAPLSAHTMTMNASIWIDVTTALLLLTTVSRSMLAARG